MFTLPYDRPSNLGLYLWSPSVKPHFKYLIVTLALALLVGLTLSGDVPAGSMQRFIDRDGDGFDDNAADDDADGMPDELEPHGFFSTAIGQLQVSPMFSNPAPAAEIISTEKNSETFGRREFHTRAVCVFRSDLNAGFDTGLGLGGGVGGGGACAGGVCF